MSHRATCPVLLMKCSVKGNCSWGLSPKSDNKQQGTLTVIYTHHDCDTPYGSEERSSCIEIFSWAAKSSPGSSRTMLGRDPTVLNLVSCPGHGTSGQVEVRSTDRFPRRVCDREPSVVQVFTGHVQIPCYFSYDIIHSAVMTFFWI